MQYDLTPSCMKATRDVTAKFCRHRRILWVSEQLCSVPRLILGILHFYYAFLIYKYTMYNIPEMTWVPITSTLNKHGNDNKSQPIDIYFFIAGLENKLFFLKIWTSVSSWAHESNRWWAHELISLRECSYRPCSWELHVHGHVDSYPHTKPHLRFYCSLVGVWCQVSI